MPTLVTRWGWARKGRHLVGRLAVSILALAIVGLLAACSAAWSLDQPATTARSSTQPEAGEIRTESRSVELVGAEDVEVRLEMGVGELRVSGGAERLLEGDFAYNVPEWRPRMEYSVSGHTGTLLVKQPSGSQASHSGASGYRNRWDLRVNSHVPMDLVVKSGVGSSRLDVGGLDLRKLDVEVGVGETIVDLTGYRARNLDVRIKGGIGSTVVRLPSDVGVRAVAKGGISSISAPGLRRDGSSYVNELYGKAPVTIHLSAESGIGEIRLEQVD